MVPVTFPAESFILSSIAGWSFIFASQIPSKVSVGREGWERIVRGSPGIDAKDTDAAMRNTQRAFMVGPSFVLSNSTTSSVRLAPGKSDYRTSAFTDGIQNEQIATH